jgi:hypothetical protein
MFHRIVLLSSPLILALIVSCQPLGGDQAVDPLAEGVDLPLGEIPDTKADGTWGHALTCKDIPQRPALVDPLITISLDGLTIEVKDQASDFRKVYAVGVGAINDVAGQSTSDESLTMFPVRYTKQNNFTIKTSTIDACRKWWTDPDTGKRSPVFAGLPFIRFYGAYGIHGPITNFTAENGGSLKRGYVSHGCVRMEALDVAELWAYIKDTPEVPVRVQKAVQRRSNGQAVDIPQKWILSECQYDSDCNYEGGICKTNALSGRKFCTAACSRYCDYDKFGYPTTFCIDDPDDDSTGYCTYKSSNFDNACRRFDHFEQAKNVSRFGETWKKATVCKPGSTGWVGDLCFQNTDCKSGLSCEQESGNGIGTCTQSCSLYCPDLTGHAGTFCVDGLCRARCDLGDNNASCANGYSCSDEPRYNAPQTTKSACMPGGNAVVVDPTPTPSVKEFTASGTVLKNEEKRFSVDLGSGATNVNVQLTGNNDADLYTKFGSAPTTQDWECRPYSYGSAESCDASIAPASKIYVMVRGWDPTSDFKLEVTWD